MSSQGKKSRAQQSRSVSVFHLPADVIDGLQVSDKLNRLQKSTRSAISRNGTAHTQANGSGGSAKAHYSTPQIDHAQQASMGAFASARLATATCHTCGGVAFESSAEQRVHFKSAWHQVNMARKLQWRRTNVDVEANDMEYPWNPVAEQAVAKPDNEVDRPADGGDGGAVDGSGSGSGSDSETESIWSESDVSVVGDDEKDYESMSMADSVENNEQQAATPSETLSYRGGKSTVDAEALSQELDAARSSGQNRHLSGIGGNADDDDDDEASGEHKPTPYLWFVPTPNKSTLNADASDSSAKGKQPDDGEGTELATVYGVQRRILVPKGQHGIHVDGHQNRHLSGIGGNADDDDDDEASGEHKPTPYLWFVPTPNKSTLNADASDSSAKGKQPDDGEGTELATVYGVQRRILVPKGQHGIHVDGHQVLTELLRMQLPPAEKKTQLELKMEKLALAQKQKEAAAAAAAVIDDEGGESSASSSKPSLMPLPEVDPQSSLWTILSMNGGYFAGAVFDNRSGKIIAHKTFHRYTTRRKQGGSQSRQDNAMGRAAKSAGAQIRRHNERMLQEEIQGLMDQWRPLLHASTRVFVRVPRTNRKGFFGSSSDPSAHAMLWSDPKIRSVPVPMGRPSLTELERAYAEITTVVVKTVDMSKFATATGSSRAGGAVGDDQQMDSSGSSGRHAVEDGGAESDHTLEPEPRPDLMAFLYHIAKMLLDESQADDAIVAYLYDKLAQLLDALSDPAIDLRYLETTDLIESHKTPTLLHLASSLGRVDLIPFLLEHGEDPTVTNGYPPLFSGGKTAYEVAKDRKTRDVFRVYRSEHEGDVDGIDWYKARVPEPLSKEKMKENEERAKEKRRRDKERRKQREREKKEKKERAKAAEQEDEQALDDALQKQAEEEEKQRSLKKNVQKMSESELRARMLSMAYASAGNWGVKKTSSGSKKGKSSAAGNAAPQPARPASPDTQRAIDRELRFKAYERRMAEQKVSATSAARGGGQHHSTDCCTHCGKSLHGVVPFEQFDWKCCSIECLHEHQELKG
ncbi:hypothetical protein GQ54DRAFT_312532 [Martensiomyces pterosporus]|nr:hypothetical protein GQ54DRAFT_312532 [Martensiomyces pterosporus]